MLLTTLIKRIHKQKLKENNLGYIDPKQNRVITKHGFCSTFRDWSAIKLTILMRSANLCLHITRRGRDCLFR